MTRVIKTLIRLAFLSVLWLLVRFTQFVLELAELNYAACEVSNAELDVQVRIKRNAGRLVPGFARTS